MATPLIDQEVRYEIEQTSNDRSGLGVHGGHGQPAGRMWRVRHGLDGGRWRLPSWKQHGRHFDSTHDHGYCHTQERIGRNRQLAFGES